MQGQLQNSFMCDKIFTFRMRFKHNRTVVEFENRGDKIM